MFNSNGANYSIPVTPFTNNNSGFGGFGGDGLWAIIILAIIFGWGNGGWGGYGAGGVSENYTLVSDMGQIERKIDGVYSGICDSTFALNNTITNGFASAQNTMTQGFAGLNTALVQQGYESRIATQGIGSQMQNCCCDLKQQIGDVNYNLATQANGITNAINTGLCQTNFNAQTNTRDIVDSQTASTRAILDKLCQMENNAKDERIAELTARNADLRLAASQQAQNAYLVNTLRPSPSPAYVVPNPYCNCNCNQTVGYYGTTIA